MTIANYLESAKSATFTTSGNNAADLFRRADTAQRAGAVVALPLSLHLQVEWHDCGQSTESLRHADALKQLCLRICGELRLRVTGNAFFQFEPSGVAGTITLQDSRIALHTWPEHNMLKADIHLPQDGGNNQALRLLEELKSYFQPAYSSIDRATRSLKPRH